MPTAIEKMLFSDALPQMLKKALDFQSMRHTIIASNIANVDTPGYKAVDIRFEKELRSAIGSGDTLAMKTTDSKHIGGRKKDLKGIKPEIIPERGVSRLDGNNVDIDREMTKLAENQLMYIATIRAMTKRGELIKYAIEQGR